MKHSNFAAQLKDFRFSLGLTQKQFASELNIRQSTLSSYENGTITPSTDVLLSIAHKYNVSLDWLFGISQNEKNINAFSDIVEFILNMNDLNELRFDLEINDKPFTEEESDTEKIYASMKFYGTDTEHTGNFAMCQFLKALKENRENFESYFIDKSTFDYWKKDMIDRYSRLPMTPKKIENLSLEERTRRKNILLEERYNFNKKEPK